jgi:hypothetical protein
MVENLSTHSGSLKLTIANNVVGASKGGKSWGRATADATAGIAGGALGSALVGAVAGSAFGPVGTIVLGLAGGFGGAMFAQEIVKGLRRSVELAK